MENSVGRRQSDKLRLRKIFLGMMVVILIIMVFPSKKEELSSDKVLQDERTFVLGTFLGAKLIGRLNPTGSNRWYLLCSAKRELIIAEVRRDSSSAERRLEVGEVHVLNDTGRHTVNFTLSGGDKALREHLDLPKNPLDSAMRCGPDF